MPKTLNSTDSTHAQTHVWLTPPSIIKALGPFDLDPCACSEPRPWPTAKEHITVEQDGLKTPWLPQDFVWLNPPYGTDTAVWLRKLIEHHNGIALVFARTDTKWFQELAPKMDCIFFLAGRLAFHRPDGTKGDSAGAPSILIGCGDLARKRILDSGLKGVFVDVAQVII